MVVGTFVLNVCLYYGESETLDKIIYFIVSTIKLTNAHDDMLCHIKLQKHHFVYIQSYIVNLILVNTKIWCTVLVSLPMRVKSEQLLTFNISTYLTLNYKQSVCARVDLIEFQS